MSAQAARLQRIVAQTVAKMSSGKLEREYEALDQVPPAPGRPELQHDTMVKNGLCRIACRFPEHNRYCNQYPLDSHIVKDIPGVPYINASWVQMPWQASDKYIITMGPIKGEDLIDTRNPDTCPDTCDDLWSMIWHVDADVAVMLCKCSKGFTGCSRYFPATIGESLLFGDISVTLEQSDSHEGFQERTFLLRKDNDRKKTVKHFQYLLWPNYGIPESTDKLVAFVKTVHNAEVAGRTGACEPRLVVHCSGGLGRSGTFLSVYMTYDLLKRLDSGQALRADVLSHLLDSDGAISLFKTVWTMRQQRHPWMVEGIQQYTVAYRTLVSLLSN